MITLMTHETLERRREELKVADQDAFLLFKARRYALFRVQTFLEGGAAPEGKHMEEGKLVEETVAAYGGLVGFAKGWDLDPLTGRVVQRDRSIWDVQEALMQRIAVPLPIRERSSNGSESNI